MFALLAIVSLFWWTPWDGSTNFGDEISRVVVERISGKKMQKAGPLGHKMLAVGSIIHFACDQDVVWGSGINGKHLHPHDYHFKYLDVRAIRGPLTRMFLQALGIKAPTIFGDPALLLPRLCPEFVPCPTRDYIVIPHISEINAFRGDVHAVFPTEPWDVVVQKICESKFVISSSLHGIIVAEAFGIPACLLRITDNEPLFKYMDYYLGSGRKSFHFARSIPEALQLGGLPLPVYDLEALLQAFPKELFEGGQYE